MRASRLLSALVLPSLLALAACGGDPADRAAAARKAFAAEDYALARTDALAALEANSTDKDMLVLLAKAQLELKDGDGAQATLVRLQSTGANGDEITRMLAEAALLRGQERQVSSLLGNDQSPAAWRLRALAHLAEDDGPAALNAFRKGMAAGDDLPTARDFGRFLLDAQDYAGASQALGVMQKIGAERLDTLMFAGDLASRQGRQDEAQGFWTKAAERYPRRIEPLLALATGADIRGKVDEAAGFVAKAEMIAPKDSRVQSMSVQVAAEKGEWEKVRSTLAPRESALDARSFEGMAYAEALLALDHPEQARAWFAKALSLSPQNPYARLMLAESLLATGDGASALRTVRPLSDSVLAGKRELDLAVRAAQKANDPSLPALRARLSSPQIDANARAAGAAQAAMARRDWAGAVGALRQIAGYEGDAEVLKRLAFASSNGGMHDQAIGYADKALQIEPRNPDMLHIAGLVRMNAGRDPDQAQRLLKQASELDPANRVFRGDLARAVHAGA